MVGVVEENTFHWNRPFGTPKQFYVEDPLNPHLFTRSHLLLMC